MDSCIFCKIINRQIPAHIVYEDADVIAFLDIAQATYGHTLVVPKKHASDLIDIDPASLIVTTQVAQKIGQRLMEVLPGIKGINLINNCRQTAGQIVMHFHFHLIPRYHEHEVVIKSLQPQALNHDEFLTLKKRIAF